MVNRVVAQSGHSQRDGGKPSAKKGDGDEIPHWGAVDLCAFPGAFQEPNRAEVPGALQDAGNTPGVIPRANSYC
jgi:hypothetical protein